MTAHCVDCGLPLTKSRAVRCKLHSNQLTQTRRKLAHDSEIIRQWRSFILPDPLTECHLWLKATSSNGYGVVFWRGRDCGAHRVAWEIAYGDIPAGMFVLHKCDVKGCVNPSHLYLGNHLDNMADSLERERRPAGSRHGMSKLTESDVAQIRELLSCGIDGASIARNFNVSVSTISLIRLGKIWRLKAAAKP